MAETEYTFEEARTRLEDILAQVRKKDSSLEHSLDLLEEGVRLANACTEQIDQSEWRAVSEEPDAGAAEVPAEVAPQTAGADDTTPEPPGESTLQ